VAVDYGRHVAHLAHTNGPHHPTLADDRTGRWCGIEGVGWGHHVSVGEASAASGRQPCTRHCKHVAGVVQQCNGCGALHEVYGWMGACVCVCVYV